MNLSVSRATARHALWIGLALASLSPAAAETYTFTASLDGASEVPPIDTEGTGSLMATYDTTTKKLNWMVTYSRLTGAPTAAHFHGPGAPGQQAPVEVPVTIGPSPVQGATTLTPRQEKDLMNGSMYFNIHTKAHPMGEIRGQVAQAEPD